MSQLSQTIANGFQQRFGQASPLIFWQQRHPMNSPETFHCPIGAAPCRGCSNRFATWRDKVMSPY
jgi:hypothetical protein